MTGYDRAPVSEEERALLHRRHIRLCICGEVWNGFVLDREGRYLRVRVQDGGEVYALPNEIMLPGEPA